MQKKAPQRMTRRALLVGGTAMVASLLPVGQPQSIDITQNIIVN